MAKDRGEPIVEVVGNAAGEHPQAFQFLAFLELAFQQPLLLLRPFLVLDVRASAEPLDDLAARVSQRQGTGQEPAILPGLATQALLDLVLLAGVRRPPPCRHRRGPVVGMQGRRPAVALDLLLGQARIVQPAGIAVVDETVRQARPDQLRHHLGQKPKTLLAHAESFLVVFRVGDVRCPTVEKPFLRERPGFPAKPAVGAVLVAVAVLELDGLLPLDELAGLREGGGVVVGVDEVQVGARDQFRGGPAEGPLPGRADPTEAAVEPGDRQEVGPDHEEAVSLAGLQLGLAASRRFGMEEPDTLDGLGTQASQGLQERQVRLREVPLGREVQPQAAKDAISAEQRQGGKGLGTARSDMGRLRAAGLPWRERLEDDGPAAPHRVGEGDGCVGGEATPEGFLLRRIAQGGGDHELVAGVGEQGDDAGIGVEGGETLLEDSLSDLLRERASQRTLIRACSRRRRCRSASASVEVGMVTVVCTGLRPGIRLGNSNSMSLVPPGGIRPPPPPRAVPG